MAQTRLIGIFITDILIGILPQLGVEFATIIDVETVGLGKNWRFTILCRLMELVLSIHSITCPGTSYLYVRLITKKFTLL